MKKIKSLLLAVVGLLCSLSVSAHDFEVDGIYYRVISSKDMTVKVTYKGDTNGSYLNEYSGSVTIPETVRRYRVIGIESYTFDGCDDLYYISIPNSVTYIGSGAFRGCFDLSTVDIEDIASWCKIDFHDNLSNPLYFARVLNVKNEGIVSDLVIPDSVKSIGDYAFYNYRNLISVISLRVLQVSVHVLLRTLV